MIRFLTLALAILALSSFALADEPAKEWKFDAVQLQPFWRTSTMHGESVLFIKGGDGGVRGKVLFKPRKVLKVASSPGEIVYEAGRDYLWQPESSEIVLPAGSRIPSK